MKTINYVRKQFSPWFVFLVCVTVPVVIFADEGCVKFDIPSNVEACDVSTDDVLLQDQRLVEVVIPVSSLVGCRNDQRVLEMMVQIRGLGTGIQVVDYGPRTQLYSDIDGSIAVERRQDHTTSIGIGASGSAAEVVHLDAKANAGRSTGRTERYNQIPAQKLLLASGTVNRGNGAYFKFRHSPQTTLEGGHEIILTLRVPSTWRGGMMRVDCLATGKEKYLLGEGDFSAGNASFVVATWLKGDVEARQIVEQYSQLESRIRSFAFAFQQKQAQSRSDGVFGQFRGGKQEARLPSDWASRFALFDSRSIQGQIKPHLPKTMQRTTDQFLASRRDVLKLAR